MTKDKKILGTDDAWENGLLGEDAEYVKRAPEGTSSQVDEALGLQMISIRLQKELIEELKVIAGFRGIAGYQPLVRDVLNRFAKAELRTIAIEYANKLAQEKKEKATEGKEPDGNNEHKKAA